MQYFLRKTAYFNSAVDIALSLVLTACGRGGGSSDTTTTDTDDTTPTINNPISVNLDVSGIKDLDLKNLEISTSNGVNMSATSTGKLALDKDDKDVVSLTNKFGTPLLMGRKLAGEDNVEINLDSTAEMLVLSTAKFMGTDIQNKKELSKRIRSHKTFEKVKKRILFSITHDQTCPLSFSCNRFLADYVTEVANDIIIEDL